MSRKYISTVISDAYKSWNNGDAVLITSPTGSGKTTFIFQELLPFAAKAKKHIVYICNRKALKEQLLVQTEQQINSLLGINCNISEDFLPFIHIVTYQYCEATNQFPNFTISPVLRGLTRLERKTGDVMGTLPQSVSISHDQIMYYIFDEAHYFISDACFNPNTNYWYYKGSKHGSGEIKDSIRVYLSATPEPLACFLACQNNPNWIIPQEIVDKLLRRSNLRNELEKETVIKKRTGSPNVEIIMNSQRSINDRCRTIKPFSDVINALKCSSQKLLLEADHSHTYLLPADYSYLTPIYFSDYIPLIKKMIHSSDKWLVFVNNENVGIDIVGRLNQEGIKAVFLSAHTRISKKTDGYHEFRNITQTQQFECTVLVATSVIDCGVNIVDPSVKHVVIAHPDKTTFLQMLGRKRIGENEKITLYIKIFDAKAINTLRYDCEKKLQFLLFFALRNELSYHKLKNATTMDDGMIGHTKLSAQILNKLVENLPRNNALIWNNKTIATSMIGPYDEIKYTSERTKILDEYDYSHTALISLLCSFSRYEDAVEEHRRSNDAVFYLKHQLSWLGKTYDPTQWLGYNESMTAMNDFLKANINVMMDKHLQTNFITSFLELLQDYPVPVQEIRVVCSAFRKHFEKIPGKNKLNNIFAKIGLPYTIHSKQVRTPNRNTQWYVTRNNL